MSAENGSLYTASGSWVLFVTLLPEADTEHFAGPVGRVETVTDSGGRVFHDVSAGDRPTVPCDAEWPAGAMVQMPGCMFPVPPQVTRVRWNASGEAEFVDASGAVVSEIRIQRDAHGRVTDIVQSTLGTVTTWLRHVYLDDQQRIETALTAHGVEVLSKTRTYNEHGDVMWEEDTMLDGTTRVFQRTYRYNDRGDWVECVVSADGDGSPTTIIRREIEYR
ncbi:MAG TPA: hypothetical protein VF432_05585 [Thermoanaerobaculia bacterium]